MTDFTSQLIYLYESFLANGDNSGSAYSSLII